MPKANDIKRLLQSAVIPIAGGTIAGFDNEEEVSRLEPLQIPLPGGSGRVPTGAVQFRDDWPGLFLRGDTAIAMSVWIRELQKRIGESDDIVVTHALLSLGDIAEIIERDVQVK